MESAIAYTLRPSGSEARSANASIGTGDLATGAAPTTVIAGTGMRRSRLLVLLDCPDTACSFPAGRATGPIPWVTWNDPLRGLENRKPGHDKAVEQVHCLVDRSFGARG
jgi:hypothetical protein